MNFISKFTHNNLANAVYDYNWRIVLSYGEIVNNGIIVERDEEMGSYHGFGLQLNL